MPDDLYHHDVLTWSERQSALLRRRVAGDRVNDAIDWQNVIEELEDMGPSQLRACRALLRQALVHLLKLHAWPESRSQDHWQDEVRALLTDASDAFAPSMRHRIDLAALYADALYRVEPMQGDAGPPPSAPTLPFTIDDLRAPRPDIAALVARLHHPGP